MSGWVPQLVISRFVQDLLRNTPAVTAALGNTHVYPGVDPTSDQVRQLTHRFAGSTFTTRPVGAPITMAGRLWDVIGWQPRLSQQSLEPVLIAAQEALIGADTAGGNHVWTDTADAARVWQFSVDAVADFDQVIEIDATRTPIWTPAGQRYEVTVSPVE